jgi:hypothetical protein
MQLYFQAPAFSRDIFVTFHNNIHKYLVKMLVQENNNISS